jgi:hypothetical protein
MTKSREELVNLALSLCYADGGSGQAADAEDFQFVDGLVGSCLSALSSRKIYPYGDPDEIEEDAFSFLATCLANMPAVAGRFGAQINAAAVAQAENHLREITAETLSYQPARAEYF